MHHVLTAAAQHKQAISSTFDSNIHSERSEERARKVKLDKKSVAFCYGFTLDGRKGLKSHVDHRGFRPQEISSSGD